MKKTTGLFLLLTYLALLAGCNTVRGLGEDIETVGSKIEDAADRKGGK